jgi:undecaprenyl-phosphate 4-deoxy-4-formamido-L-arabinose transferase
MTRSATSPPTGGQHTLTRDAESTIPRRRASGLFAGAGRATLRPGEGENESRRSSVEPHREIPELSVVVSCFFEEESIDEFHRRLAATLDATGRSHEIVYVNDGSRDRTLERLHALFEGDPRVEAVVDLYRNSGQAAAVTAGCAHARGRRLVFLDSDLQLDPEDLPRLLALADEGHDVVFGYREARRDALPRRVASWLVNLALRRVAKTEVRDFGCNFRVLDAELVRAFGFGPFKIVRLASLVAAAGSCAETPVRHHPRRYGRSGWSAGQLLSYWIDNALLLSRRPFQLLSLLCFAVGLLLVLRVLLGLVLPMPVLSEVTNGLILNALVFSLLVVVGVSAGIGEYVIRSFLMLQGSPAYVVRSVRTRARAAG